ncbi:MAG: hypothetical protein SGBAC_011116 [Bacillariaceae sp.]
MSTTNDDMDVNLDIDIDIDESCSLYDEAGEEEEIADDEECIVGADQCLLVLETSVDEAAVSTSATESSNVPLDVDEMPSISYLPYDEDASEMELLMDKILQFAPFFLPVVAYNLYDPTAIAFAALIDFLTTNNWVAVDGGAYQAMIIAPVINGVVVSCKLNEYDDHMKHDACPQFHLRFHSYKAISLLFAIQIGLTISKLWQRKNDIQLCITLEASKLMMLRNLLSDFPSTNETQEKCIFYLLQYTSRLISECHETVNIGLPDISQTDSELIGCMEELNKAASASPSSGYCTLLLDQSMAAVDSLGQSRSRRISALQSTFPLLHYVLLGTLALSICFAFLMETDQDILVFLNAIQLRLLWTMLVATFSALGLVCYDLGHPFRGFYQISDSVKELYDVRLEYSTSPSIGNDQLQ